MVQRAATCAVGSGGPRRWLAALGVARGRAIRRAAAPRRRGACDPAGGRGAAGADCVKRQRGPVWGHGAAGGAAAAGRPWLLAWLDAPARPTAVAPILRYQHDSCPLAHAAGRWPSPPALGGRGTSPESGRRACQHPDRQTVERATGPAPQHSATLGAGSAAHRSTSQPVAGRARLGPDTPANRCGWRGSCPRASTDRCHFLQAEFTRSQAQGRGLRLPSTSHVRALTADTVLRAALNHLAPGGAGLVEDGTPAPHRARLFDSLRTGWRLSDISARRRSRRKPNCWDMKRCANTT